MDDESMEQNDDTIERPRIRMKKRLREDKRGVCYLSRVPPRMDPSNLRQLLSRFGEIQRIYLVPQGGKRRSSFYFDIWNIKYSSKFKWDDLTSEIAEKNRTWVQKLALEKSAAKRERDFYLSKVDQSRTLNSMQEHMKKKQKTQEPASNESDGDARETEVIRKFPQNRPVNGSAVRSKPALSKDFLMGARYSVPVHEFFDQLLPRL